MATICSTPIFMPTRSAPGFARKRKAPPQGTCSYIDQEIGR